MYKIFTDGACIRNGKPGAKAAYGVIVTGGEFGNIDNETNLKIAGLVEPASNNRGELTAILVALKQSLLFQNNNDVEIVSDSLISIKTFEEWLPKRKTKGTASEMANYDLIEEIDELLTANRKIKKITFTHVYSHTNDMKFINKVGNDRVDRLATALLLT